jgi:Transglycosylase SLT domain
MYVKRTRGLGDTSGVAAQIQAAAPSYGVPPALALAVAQRESGLNQAAVGTSGEIGVFQLMPGTAAQLGVNPSDLTANIDGGLTYLSQLHQQFGDWGTALEAYNGGPGNVQRGTVSSAAQSYSASVLAAAGMSSDSDAPSDTGAASDSGDDSAVTPDVGVPSTVLVGGALALAGLAAWWAFR